MVKVGIRHRSFAKSFSAKTKGRATRSIKRAVIPGYGKRGRGWAHPKRKLYSKVYSKTTVDSRDLFKPKKQNHKSNKTTHTGATKMKKQSGYGWGCAALLILLAIGTVVAYWYVFVAIAAIGGAIWYFTSRKKKDHTTDAPEHENDVNNQQEPEENSDLLQQAEEEVIAEDEATTNTVVQQEPLVSTPKSEFRPYPVVHKIRRKLHSYVVFDIETTGFNRTDDDIIQLSGIRVEKDEVTDTFDTYIHPDSEIPRKITILTGISNDMVQSAPSVSEVIPKFEEFTHGLPLVGHNIVKFDIPFMIAHGFYQQDIDALDTWRLALYNSDFPEEMENLKLPTLNKYFGIRNTSHNALEDCKTNKIVYEHLRDGELARVPLPPLPQSLTGLRFAVTGDFITSSRPDVEEMIAERGGKVTGSVSHLTDYLVDGDQVSDVLTDGTHSAKELKAYELCNEGGKIKIIDYSTLQNLIDVKDAAYTA